MSVTLIDDYSTDETHNIHEIYDPTLISSIRRSKDYEDITGRGNESTYSSDYDYNATGLDQLGDTMHMPEYSNAMLGFTAGSAFIIAVLGTIGNLLTIVALPMNKRLRNSGTALVINLAVAELLFCLLVLPLTGAQLLYLKDEHNLLDDNLCVFFVTFRYTITQTELQTILAIALTRAIAVSFPHAYAVINKLEVTAVYIALIWIYSFIIRLPIVLGIYGHYELNHFTMECDVAEQASEVQLVYLIVEAAIPVFLIFFLYIIITILIVRNGLIKDRHRKKSQTAYSASKPPNTISTQPEVIKNANKVSRASEVSMRRIGVVTQPSISSSTGTSSTTDGGVERTGSVSSFQSFKKMLSQDGSIRSGVFHRRSSSLQRRLNTHRRDIRVVRSIFVIFIMLLVCSVPVAIEHTLVLTVKNYDNYNKLLGLHVLYWAQYCLNMIVYVLMNRQYRDAYIDCIAKIIPGWERHRGFRFFWENQSVVSKPTQGNQTSSIKAIQRPSSDLNVPPSPEPKFERSPFIEKRLSTIAEGHSSSAAAAMEDSISEQKSEKKSIEHHEDENSNLQVDEDVNAYSGDIEGNESDEDSFSKSFEYENEYLNGGPRYDRYETDSEEEKEFMGRNHWYTENGTTPVKPITPTDKV